MTDDAKGLDETRRLAYMALLRQRTEKYELAASLVNALVHHHPCGLGAEEVTDHLVAVTEEADGYQVSRNWLRQQIARITAELDRS